ncbi:MAG: hypothetical protein DRJ50_11770, partial [Actinobacteria bacterium]
DPVDVSGMFMANSLVQSLEWQVPDSEPVIIEPGGYLVILADDDTDQMVGGEMLHTNFKLNSSIGSEVALFDTVDHGNVRIHGYRFGKQNADLAYGYLPEDSDAPEYITPPTPGASNETASYYSPIVINEFHTTSFDPEAIDDWLEIYNRGDSQVDLFGYGITDERDTPMKFTIPWHLFIAPGAWISIDETILLFAWSSTGVEVVQIVDAAGGAVDFYDYGLQSDDISEGRFPDGTPNWHFFPEFGHTRGWSNTCSGTALAPVENLRFLAATCLAWDPVVLAEDYDTIAVDVGTLVSSAGDYSASVIDCARNNARSTIVCNDTVPVAGQVIGYVVRASSFSCDFGTYDAPVPNEQQGPRDSGIAAAPGACP